MAYMTAEYLFVSRGPIKVHTIVQRTDNHDNFLISIRDLLRTYIDISAYNSWGCLCYD